MTRTASVLLAAALAAPAAATHAATSAQDAELSVHPVVHYFAVTEIGTSSQAAVFMIHNYHPSADRSLQTLELVGPDADQFTLSADTCSDQTLAAGGACSVGVAFRPTSRGSKAALLRIPSNDPETPVLSAYVSNYENDSTEAERRLPPVLAAIGVAETLVAGSTYDLTWTLEGYHGDYLANMVLFDCTGVAVGDCGNSYDGADKLAESGSLGWVSDDPGLWTYGDAATRRFHYTWHFTVPATRSGGAPWAAEGSDVVLRLYVKSAEDDAGDLGGVSLLIPGNQAARYYDTTGRRILKSIAPP